MGFTLILVDEEGAYFSSNKSPRRKLEPGIYSLANASLDTPWPKLVYGKDAFRYILNEYYPTAENQHQEEDELFHQLRQKVLNDHTVFPHPLPGIHDAHTEIMLSSILIEPYKWRDYGFYGTRMQTLFVIRGDGSVRVQEHSLDTLSPVKDWRGIWSKVQFEVSLRMSTL